MQGMHNSVWALSLQWTGQIRRPAQMKFGRADQRQLLIDPFVWHVIPQHHLKLTRREMLAVMWFTF